MWHSLTGHVTALALAWLGEGGGIMAPSTDSRRSKTSMNEKKLKSGSPGRTALKLGAAAGAGILIGRALRPRRFSFYGKSVVICGGSRGLGLMLARRFADEGARLTLIARGQEQLERAQDELAARGAQVLVLPCDMREQAAATNAISQVIERFGGVDVLVNNLGILRAGPIENMTVSDFVDHLDVHFWGPLYACLAAIPHMKRRRSGRIVNVASIGGKIAVPHLVPYSASKFALVGLSEGLAAELAKDGIRVTTVCPWLMRTGSHTAAEMKGRHELEYRWFALMASLPPLSISADKVANQIVEACRRGDRRLLPSVQARIASAIDELFPRLSAAAMAAMNRMLPAPSARDEVKAAREVRTGPVLSLLTRLSDRAAERHNQLRT